MTNILDGHAAGILDACVKIITAAARIDGYRTAVEFFPMTP
jgi:hypothetical protein